MKSYEERIHAHAVRQAARVERHLNRSAPAKTPGEIHAQQKADLLYAQRAARQVAAPPFGPGLGPGGI